MPAFIPKGFRPKAQGCASPELCDGKALPWGKPIKHIPRRGCVPVPLSCQWART